MDSLTHIVLGAAIGDTLLGKKIGRKAALVGAFAKTFPDFDLLYTGINDPRLYICDHRGHTHSLFWEFIYAFPLAYIFFLLFKKKVAYKEWFLLFIVCLWGHSLLDTCTNFGTRLLLPFTTYAFSWNNLAIVDLLYTLPMLLLVIGGLVYKNDSKNRDVLIRSSLVYCGLYLGFTFLNKAVANNVVEKSLKANAIPYTHYFTNPTMLNNILWYGMAANDSVLSVGEFTLLNKDKPMQWYSYKRNTQLLDLFPDTADIKLLKWYSKDYTISRANGDTLDVYCVKFGRTNMIETEMEKTFIMCYKLYQKDGVWQMGMTQPSTESANLKVGVKDLWGRILH